MIQIYVNLQPMLASLARLGGKVANSTIMLDEVGDYLEGRILENFRKEVDPYNSKWAPLSPATIADKKRKGYPLDKLLRTGKMKRSLKVITTGKTLRIEIDFPAQFHQRGTRRMPQRQILPEDGLSRKDERNVVDIMVDYLDV